MNQYLKISSIILAIMMSFLTAHAQADQPRKHEFGIVTSTLASYGFIYKRSFHKGMLRISTTNFGLDINTTSKVGRNTFGLVVGYETRRLLSEKVTYTRGPEVGLSATQNYDTNNGNYTLAMSPRVFYYWGLQYDLTDHIYVGGEIRPSLSGSITTSNTSTLTGNVGFDLDISTRVRLHLVYVL